MTDLIELQATLRADAGGRERRRLEDQLETLRLTAKRKLDAGVTPAEFTRLNGLMEAAEAARDVVATTWSRHHGAA